MIKRKLLIACVVSILITFLLIYLCKYQWVGYSRKVSFTNMHTVKEISDNFSPYVISHSNMAFVELHLQEIEMTEETIMARYSNYEKQYILTLVYIPQDSELSIFINRTLKMAAPNLNLSQWRYDIDYFQSEVGPISEYDANSKWGGDRIFFTVDDIRYEANPLTGELCIQ